MIERGDGRKSQLWLCAAVLACVTPGLAWADCPELAPTDLSNCGPTYTLPQWSTTAGWDQPQYYETIQTADLDGDGRHELIARGALGIYVYTFDLGSGQWTIPRGSLVSLPLSDVDGWDQPQYYETIQTGNIDGIPGAELLARGAAGLVAYAWNPDANTFSALNAPSILPDSAGWNLPQYGTTIQAADIDGDGRDEVLARGISGLATIRWNGSQFVWTAGSIPAFSDANGYTNPAYYETIQTGRITDRTKDQIVARGPNGLVLYSFNGSDYADVTPPGGGGFRGTPNDFAENYRTIQAADIDGDGFEEVIGRDGSFDGSLVAYSRSSWSQPFSVPNNGYESWAETAETIHAADVDGDGDAEVVGLGPEAFFPRGIYVANYNTASRQFEFLQSATPALDIVSVWQRPDLYRTIQSANVDGAPGDELLARGLYGMRTWVPVQGGGYARPVPYGYPAWSPAEQTAYNALNVFLGFTSQQVRDLYSGSNSPNASAISSTMNAIAGLCQNEIGAQPLQYATCATPPGSQGVDPLAYTAVSNEILAELFWAGETLGYFAEQGDILEKLFQNQSATLPSLAADLELQGAQNKKVHADYFALFSGFSVAALTALSVIPEFAVVAALGEAAFGFIGTLNDAAQGSQPNVDPIARTYAEILDEVATQQEQQQDALEAQRLWVMSDLSLLQAVGSQINSGAFKINQDAALSASRQAFSLWAYQLFLPDLWRYYVVTSCKNSGTPGESLEASRCKPPSQAPYVNGTTGTKFSAILDDNTRCYTDCSTSSAGTFCTDYCDWTTPDSTTWGTLTTPLTAACTYDGGSVVWEYGCSLDVAPDDLFANRNGWQFDTRLCHPGKCSTQSAFSTGPATEVQLKRAGTKNAHLSLEGSIAVDPDFDTRSIVAVSVWRVLFDLEEYVELHDEDEALPLVLELRSRSRKRARLSGTTPAGGRVDLDIRARKGELQLGLDVRRADLSLAHLCDRPGESELAVELEILLAQGDSLTFSPVNLWKCSESGVPVAVDQTGVVAPTKRANQRRVRD